MTFQNDPDKEHSMSFGSSVIKWTGRGLLTATLGAADYQIYMAAEAAHPGMGWAYAGGTAALELIGYLFWKSRVNKINVSKSENYLSKVLKEEVADFAPFENKLGTIDQKESLAWLVDQTISNYQSARQDYTTKVDQALLVEGYASLLEQSLVTADSVNEVRNNSFPSLEDGPSKQLNPMSFLTFYDRTNQDFDLEAQVRNYVRDIRGTDEPSPEIRQYAQKVWAFSEALNGRNEPLERLMLEYAR